MPRPQHDGLPGDFTAGRELQLDITERFVIELVQRIHPAGEPEEFDIFAVGAELVPHRTVGVQLLPEPHDDLVPAAARSAEFEAADKDAAEIDPPI
ncbi:hypothetical protein SDC9_148665 [bioreactor metagenome]|uniref:Uncharacterized protein n=1 Tax=bioreactor metagenome TaxID=1076179 RepID=A0A645EJ31_9ZZZZ